MTTLTRGLGLSDAFRSLHPLAREYTRTTFSSNTASGARAASMKNRLDYAYVSSHLLAGTAGASVHRVLHVVPSSDQLSSSASRCAGSRKRRMTSGKGVVGLARVQHPTRGETTANWTPSAHNSRRPGPRQLLTPPFSTFKHLVLSATNSHYGHLRQGLRLLLSNCDFLRLDHTGTARPGRPRRRRRFLKVRSPDPTAPRPAPHARDHSSGRGGASWRIPFQHRSTKQTRLGSSQRRRSLGAARGRLCLCITRWATEI